MIVCIEFSSLDIKNAHMNENDTCVTSLIWYTFVFQERATILRKWAQLLVTNHEHLAKILTLENVRYSLPSDSGLDNYFVERMGKY